MPLGHDSPWRYAFSTGFPPLKLNGFPGFAGRGRRFITQDVKRFATKSIIRLPRLVAGCVRSLRTKRIAVEKKSPRKKRVLLVDDETALTRICKLMLERTDDFVVEEENFGARALSTAREFRPDVIFLDIRLPDKDGHTIAAELKSDPELRSVPIVLWSGSVSKREEVVANSHGCWPTLPKPFSHHELRELATNPSYSQPKLAGPKKA